MKESNLLQLLKVADPETYEKMVDILKRNERKEEKKEKDNFLEEEDGTDCLKGGGTSATLN